MKTVLVTVGCRSDEGLSAPIIKRLKESDWCDVQIVQLEPQNFIASYQIAEYYCRGEPHIGNHNHKKPDLLFVTGDRVEQCAAAAAAFHNNVKIAHYGAGIINDPITTYDDVDRHCITLWSDIQFCESYDTADNAENLKFAATTGGEPWGWEGTTLESINVVGIPHLDDLEVDESLVPFDFSMEGTETKSEKPSKYSLILYNPPTIKNNDIQEIFANSHLYNDYTILIGSNPDGDTDTYLMDVVDDYYPNLPRAQFLGLLKNCKHFITNSSSAIYEAPHFLKPEQIIMIGDRNKNRPKGPFETGASDKIVKILQEYLC